MVTLDKYLLNDFFLDIKSPIQVFDLINLMKENNLNEASDLLIQTIKENRFNKNDTIYVNNILNCYDAGLYIYNSDNNKDCFEVQGDGTYSYSYTDRISQLGLINSDKRAQDLYIPCDDNKYFYIGIILG